MAQPQYLETPQGRRIAFHWTDGAGPPIVFLGGFKSDMNGTKAIHLESWARTQGRAFLRFDYSGHGQSSGAFEDGSIGEWSQDALSAIELCGERPPVLVGSSMGGWIALLVAKLEPKIAGVVGIAAAPDFTEDSFWAGFSTVQRTALLAQGRTELPSDYDEPFVITQKLIEDGRKHLILRDPLDLPFPVRLLQGTADSSVSAEVALRLMTHATSRDMRLTFVKGADHSFSTPECLSLIQQAILEVSA